eukprot:3549713-Prymnesium_polylepis.1
MATETQHLSDSDSELSDNSNILSDSDNESNPASPVTEKQKVAAPEYGDNSLFPSADDTADAVMSDEEVRAVKWAKWDEKCEFKNGQWYFPKGEDGKSREFWEDRTIEYEPE